LASANLNGANFKGADLRSANLNGATLLGTNLTGADLRDVDLENAILSYTIMPDGCCVIGTNEIDDDPNKARVSLANISAYTRLARHLKK
jgi:uncharacterized protein YjbI with pentapeptide repeats